MNKKNIYLYSMMLIAYIHCSSSFAQSDFPAAIYPTIPQKSSTIEGFIPKGWQLEYQQQGDLNADVTDDVALVLHENNQKNILKNEGLGSETIDTNPRMLIVAFRDKRSNDYIQVLEDHTLIPRHTDPVLDDPLKENGLKIAKGNLLIALQFFASAGSWEMSNTTLTFRFKDDCFRLIGYDQVTTHRASGEVNKISINFLTQKAKVSKGSIEDDHIKSKWRSIKGEKKWCLPEIGNGQEFNPL